MTKLLTPIELNRLARRQFSHWDDFHSFTSAQLWTSVLTDSGTAAVGDAHGGVLTLTPSDGTVADNDQTIVKTTNELFLLDADNTMRFGALLKFTEANTDDANVMFGVANAVAADVLLDDGGGPKTSFSGAVFYKVDGGTVWRVRSSVGTTYTDTVLTTAAGGAYQLLEIEFKAVSLTRVQVTFFVDGQPVLDPGAGYARPLEHYLDATSATEMQLFAAVKNGGANLETLLIDGMGWDCVR